MSSATEADRPPHPHPPAAVQPAMPSGYAALDAARAAAVHFLQTLPTRRASPAASANALRAALAGPLPEHGVSATHVLASLPEAIDPGLLGSGTGRFFGWVIGGAHPAAIAADWLASAWDQNAAAYATSPAMSVLEEVTGAWLKDLLGLPTTASYAFVTGCQMAHASALAAARHKLLGARGIDVEADGLAGAPRLRILTGATRHESLLRAARLTGFGTKSIEIVETDAHSRLNPAALRTALRAADAPTVVVLQAGDMATGAFDPFAPCCDAAHEAGAWVHVDGAIGLFAAASPRLRHLLEGVTLADSWATDGHKWLNVTQDCGYVFMADPAAHRTAFAQDTNFAHGVAETRRPLEWGPEWSRRARALPTYAVLKTLGRSGVATMLEHSVAMAQAIVEGIGQLPGAEVLARPQINQGLVRFLDSSGDHDSRTEAVAARVQAEGVAWFGTTLWRGMRAMRVSVCDWRTDAGAVEAAVSAVARAV